MYFNKIVFGTLGYVLEFRRPLAKALLIPFLLYMAIDAMTLMHPNQLGAIVLGVVSLMVQTNFAITTHRIMLLGPQSVPSWGILSWSRRETSFALHLIGLVLIAIPIAFLMFIPVVGWIIAYALIVWVIGRLSLVFPTIAIDHNISFPVSWQMTRRYQFLMIFVVLIFPILIMIPAFLVRLLPYSFLLTSFLSTLATVFTVTALSVAYKLIKDEETRAPSQLHY